MILHAEVWVDSKLRCDGPCVCPKQYAADPRKLGADERAWHTPMVPQELPGVQSACRAWHSQAVRFAP